jgi:hypothetical protein
VKSTTNTDEPGSPAGSQSEPAVPADQREQEENARMAAQLRQVGSIPSSGIDLIQFAAAISDGKVGSEFSEVFGELVMGLIGLIWRASKGDARARLQLQAIDRFVYPEDYSSTDKRQETLPKRIQEIATISISDSLRRGWQMMELMGRLAAVVVQPKRRDEKLKPSSAIKRKDSLGSWEISQCGQALYDAVQNDRNWNAKTTLKTLARKIYQDAYKGSAVSPKQLEKDLKRAEQWSKRSPAATRFMVGAVDSELPLNSLPYSRSKSRLNRQ